MNFIEFSAPKNIEYFLKDVLPIPAKLNIPDWFKKLNHTPKLKTVKGCMPFLDALTAGYILKMPQDLYLKHNVLNKETKKFDSFFQYSIQGQQGEMYNLNNETPQIHPSHQLEGSPLLKKNSKENKLPFYKILNPFHIKTPKGYSCLFIPPLNNKDDRFEIISGIVDTDIFQTEINFPFFVNTDKYPSLETTIQRGTPYVQVIPFKRDEWKFKVEFQKRTSLSTKEPFHVFKKLINNYKTFVWNKKKWR